MKTPTKKFSFYVRFKNKKHLKEVIDLIDDIKEKKEYKRNIRAAIEIMREFTERSTD